MPDQEDRLDAAPEQAGAQMTEASAASKPQEIPAQLRRVVVADGEEPDWMVSAGQVSGAAERRNAPAARSAAARENRQPVRPPHREEKTGQPDRSERPERPEKREMPRAQGVRTAKKMKKKKPAAAPTKAKAAPRKLSKKAAARRSAQIRRTLIACAATALLLVVLIAGGMGLGRLLDIKRTLDRGMDVFYPNLFVNGIALEGKTLDEARELVGQQVSSLVSSWGITLRTHDGRSWHITG